MIEYEKLHIRPLCTNKIEPFIGKDLIKVITDQRRICKSYILFANIGYHKRKDTGS